jgi:hypothetical protein
MRLPENGKCGREPKTSIRSGKLPRKSQSRPAKREFEPEIKTSIRQRKLWPENQKSDQNTQSSPGETQLQSGKGKCHWKIEKRFGKQNVLAAAENFRRLPETSVRCGKLQTKNQKSGDGVKSAVGEPQPQAQNVDVPTRNRQ